MAQICTVCSHRDVESINREIVAGTPNTRIAAKYGLKEQSVRRHKDKHLPGHLAQSKKAEEVTQADSLIGDLQGLRGQALDFLKKAKEAEDLRAAAPLIGAAVKVIEVLAEVRGELDRKAQINIFLNPQYQMIQTTILKELEPYPDIRLKISDALGACQND